MLCDWKTNNKLHLYLNFAGIVQSGSNAVYAGRISEVGNVSTLSDCIVGLYDLTLTDTMILFIGNIQHFCS